jgi:ABC-type multidrug transport system fused ATPase/permease subunit
MAEPDALVLQDIHLFPGTILENLRAFDQSVAEQRVWAAAKALGADRFIRRLPAGYDTILAERGTNLSLGERQLLCYVRAMVRNPELLILDEATSAVDAVTEHRLQTAMQALMAGRTTLIIAHRLATITTADRILVFDHGCLAETGTHQELLHQRGIYRHLASLQGLDQGQVHRRVRPNRQRQHSRSKRVRRWLPPPAGTKALPATASSRRIQ